MNSRSSMVDRLQQLVTTDGFHALGARILPISGGTMIGPMKDLLSHQAWADARYFRAWEASGALEDEDLRTRTQHLVATQEGFLQVLKGEAVVFPEEALPELPALKARCEANHLVFQALGRGLDEAALARIV